MSITAKIIVAAVILLTVAALIAGCDDRSDEEIAGDICQEQGLVLGHWEQDGSDVDADQTWSCVRVEEVDTLP